MILKRLLTLSPLKSTGCRLLTNRVLKECVPFIANSLTYLYNLSMNTGVFPSDWKSAIVVPIYKNHGLAHDPTNYQPISLLPAVGKLFPAVQSAALSSYL